MIFPSRQKLHQTVEILDEWSIQDFFNARPSPAFNHFEDWCHEISTLTSLRINHGLTKISVDFGDNNWVIKIPFGNSTNYCQLEAKMYALAHKKGLGEYFAPCFFYGKIKDIPIYLQRKVEINEELNLDACYYYMRTLCESFREHDETDEDFEDRVQENLDYMTDEDAVKAIIGETKGLLSFLYDNDICDLHSGNFGFLNSNPVIFDYSGI